VGPLLAAVAAFALSTGGFGSAFLTFVLFAATMAALMLLVSLLVGTSQNTLLRSMRTSSRAIQRVSSIVLIVVGAGLVYFTIDLEVFRTLFFPFVNGG
jgi:cytochrome c biogenesis protein CcdA